MRSCSAIIGISMHLHPSPSVLMCSQGVGECIGAMTTDEQGMTGPQGALQDSLHHECHVSAAWVPGVLL